MDYKIKTIVVNKSVKMNVGNYESVGLDFGMEIEPKEEIKSDEERDVLITAVSKDLDDIIGPQMVKIRNWAETRFKDGANQGAK